MTRPLPHPRGRERRASAERLERRALLTVDLTADIGREPVSSADFGELTDVNGTLFFRADDMVSGPELWRVNPGGDASLVKDIYPGPTGAKPTGLYNANGTLYFAAASPTAGTELWKSDGTAAGTVQVADVTPGPAGSFPYGFRRVGDTVFFFANRAGDTSGYEVWKTDGTAAGTVFLGSARSQYGISPRDGVDLNGTLMFVIGGTTAGGELWRSDGTSAGTQLVRRFTAGVQPKDLTVVGDTLFFSCTGDATGLELWKSDGTAAGTVPVKDIRPGSANSSPTNFVAGGGLLYFTADDGTHGVELWASDGTDGGTYLVKDIRAGGGTSGSGAPTGLTMMGGVLYFSASEATTGRELWRSDGTDGGTYLVANLRTGTSSSNPAALAATTADGAGVLYFAANGTAGSGVYRSDGTDSGTYLLHRFFGASDSLPTAIVPSGPSGTAYFLANDGESGKELWRTDGTDAGTVLVRDIYPKTGSSWPSFIGALGDTAFFFADDGINGFELWKSDGTPGGATLVKDINPAGDAVPQFGGQPGAVLDGVLYFAADNRTSGRELWRTDGTEAGTWMVKNIFPDGASPSSSRPTRFTVFNGAVYFTLENSASLYRTDGTEAGTTFVKGFGGTSGLAIWGEVNGRLLINGNEAATGAELWTSDGTPAGTILLKDINPGAATSRVTGVRRVTPTLAMFFAEDGNGAGNKLFRTDGTPQGTVLVTDMQPGTDDWYAGGLAASGGKYFWSNPYGLTGEELWVSDGTAAGTHLVKDIDPGPGSSRPNSLTDLNGIVLFGVTFYGQTGSTSSLWRSDGTEAGTYMLKDVAPDFSSTSGTSVYVVAGGEMYFAGGERFGKVMVWKTDGTAEGTVAAANVLLGTSGYSGVLFPAGDSVFFSGDDGASGMEVWRLSLDGRGPRVVESRLETPAGGDRRAVFRFDEDLVPTVRDAVPVLTDRDTGSRIINASLTRLPGGPANVASFAVTGPGGTLPAGAYRVSLLAGSVTDGQRDPQPSAAFVDFDVRATVAGRFVFYNNSAFDGQDPQLGGADDGAVATDKRVLPPGQASSFANVSTYGRGINGVMIDVAALPTGALTAQDVQIETGDGATWSPLPAGVDPVIQVRRGAGASGSDRVALALPDGLVKNTWLRVTLKATARTGLAAPDVFYVGHLAGETGDARPGGRMTVDAIDLLRTRRAVGPGARVDNPYDFNRDGTVNAADVLVVRNNQRRTLAPLSAGVTAAGAPVPVTLRPTPRRSTYLVDLLSSI